MQRSLGFLLLALSFVSFSPIIQASDKDVIPVTKIIKRTFPLKLADCAKKLVYDPMVATCRVVLSSHGELDVGISTPFKAFKVKDGTISIQSTMDGYTVVYFSYVAKSAHDFVQDIDRVFKEMKEISVIMQMSEFVDPEELIDVI